MIHKLPIASYLAQVATFDEPILDVRSPKEFLKGHIPGANNLPLFEDDERHLVGLMYKQEGRDPAVRKGYELVGPKLTQFVKTADMICPDRKLAVHRDNERVVPADRECIFRRNAAFSGKSPANQL